MFKVVDEYGKEVVGGGQLTLKDNKRYSVIIERSCVDRIVNIYVDDKLCKQKVVSANHSSCLSFGTKNNSHIHIDVHKA